MNKIISVGPMATDLIEGNMVILFSESAPKELMEYCVIHNSNQQLNPDIIYHKIILGKEEYKINRIGSEAYQTWNDLGHLTLRLLNDGTDLPGSVYLESDTLILPEVGTLIEFEG